MSGQPHHFALHSLAWTAIVFCLIAAWGTRARAEDVVRVLVAEGRPALTLVSAGPLTLTDGTGQRTLGQRAAGGSFASRSSATASSSAISDGPSRA